MPNEKGTTLYKVQKKFQNVFGFTLPLFHGRGILNCRVSLPSRFVKLTALSDNWGLLPYRRQIIAVSESPVVPPCIQHGMDANFKLHRTVGRPVHVQKTDNPSIEQIREVQEAYITELLR
jgi:2-acylglycerol O-acyltransferase 2